jgi:rhomboid family GlyGly-CTERM serine protease
MANGLRMIAIDPLHDDVAVPDTATPGRAGKLWLALCVLLALGSLLGWVVPATLWDWQPSLAAQQPWRWWTAALVHWSPLHLLTNLAGLAVIAAFGRVAAVPAVVTLAWLASWPLTHLVLWIKPELAHYGGLSGVLHGGVVVVALFVACTEPGRRRLIAIAVLAALCAKLLLEAPWGPALQRGGGWDIAVAPLAHASGAIVAALCTLLALARGPAAPPIESTPPPQNAESP